MIRTIADVKKAVNHTYYPPFGERGVGLARAQSYGLNFENYKNRINDDVKLILQIEHIDAINILEEIISFDGVSGTFIGLTIYQVQWVNQETIMMTMYN